MNKFVAYFTGCTPAPSGGYQIEYRVAGSSGAYTNAGNFFSSPAVFYDTINPAGTCYEGFIRSVCGDLFGMPVYFETCTSGAPPDNSSCGTSISTTTTDPGYMDLGLFVLHVDGAVSVNLNWDTYDRPNRFTLYEDGVLIQSTGWKGIAAYPGPWGVSGLSAAESGIINFIPIPGHVYTLNIEVGPTGPPNYLDDNFNIAIVCS